MPPPDEPERTETPAEFGAGYGGEQGLKEISEMFHDLARDIEVCNNNILNYMRTTTTINRQPFFSLTNEQDEDLFRELAHINDLLGKARMILNAYITVENSLPDFKVFFDRLHEIESLLDYQKSTIFFEVHVRDDERCLYPKKEIEKKVKMFITMLGGVRGSLKGAGKFIEHSQILQGAGGSNGEDRGYRNSSSQRNTGMGAYPEEHREEQALGM